MNLDSGSFSGHGDDQGGHMLAFAGQMDDTGCDVLVLQIEELIIGPVDAGEGAVIINTVIFLEASDQICALGETLEADPGDTEQIATELNDIFETIGIAADAPPEQVEDDNADQPAGDDVTDDGSTDDDVTDEDSADDEVSDDEFTDDEVLDDEFTDDEVSDDDTSDDGVTPESEDI